MSQEHREIRNPRTGQRMRFLLTAADTDGELLRVETVNPPSSVVEPLHVHPHQESRAEVVSGTLRFVVDGRERRLGPGEAITIPAGTPHHFANDGAEDAVAIQEFRPAMRTAEFFETYFGIPASLSLARPGFLRGDPAGQPPVAAAARRLRAARPDRAAARPFAGLTFPPREGSGGRRILVWISGKEAALCVAVRSSPPESAASAPPVEYA